MLGKEPKITHEIRSVKEDGSLSDFVIEVKEFDSFTLLSSSKSGDNGDVLRIKMDSRLEY